jgi:hypothetical protein
VGPLIEVPVMPIPVWAAPRLAPRWFSSSVSQPIEPAAPIAIGADTSASGQQVVR